MGVSESWAHDRVSDAELSLRGYDLYRCDRPSGHRGGGVLLYVKRSLSSVQFVTRAKFPEQVWCKLIVYAVRFSTELKVVIHEMQ